LTEVIIMLSHDQVVIFKTFRDIVEKCARQTIKHAASKIKQAQLQLWDYAIFTFKVNLISLQIILLHIL
jgi:hypothetical protein